MSKLDRALLPSTNPTSVARIKGKPCPTCNQHHKKPDGRYLCVGHNKATGGPCGNWPIKGGEVCRQKHGGATPQVREVAQRRLDYMAVEGEIAKLLRDVDLPEQHPADGLLEIVRHAGAMMRMLGALTGQLDTDPQMGWVIAKRKTGHGEERIRVVVNESIIGVDHEGDQTADVRVILYHKWTDMYLKACKTALDADIDERMVRNATATSDAFFRALNVGLAAAKLTPEQATALTTALAGELRKLSPVGPMMGG